MSWSPVLIKHKKIEKPDYVEVRIPRVFTKSMGKENQKITLEYHFDFPFENLYVNQTHINKIEKLDSAFCKYYAKQSDQGDDHVVHTGFFLQFPPFTFSLKKPVRIGFEGEKEYEEFAYDPIFEESILQQHLEMVETMSKKQYSPVQVLEFQKAIGTPIAKT